MESLRRGASGMDAARAVKGRGRRRQGWPLRGDPRSSDGMREVERSEPGTPSSVQGQAFLVTFEGPAIRAFGKSDSPSRAKPMLRPAGPIVCEYGAKASEAPRKAQPAGRAEKGATSYAQFCACC